MQSDEATVSHPGIGSIFGSRSWHGRGPRAMVDIALAHRHPCQWLAAVTILGGLLIVAGLPCSWTLLRGSRCKELVRRPPYFRRSISSLPGCTGLSGIPLYVAVVSVIIGQGLLLGNFRILEYGALVWLAFHLFVLAYEEPTLHASFGPEYEQFCAAVPRWVPRLHPWPGPQENA